MADDYENQGSSGSGGSRIENILAGTNLKPPMSRVENLLYALLNGAGSGMSADEIRAYIDEQLANAEGLSADTLAAINMLKDWIDENGDELESLIARVKKLEDDGPYAKIRYVDELPSSDQADPNTIYMLERTVDDNSDHYLKYRFVNDESELPSPEEADPDTIYIIRN